MTADSFIKAVEGYYGRYERPVMRETVRGYVAQRYRDSEIDALWQLTLLGFSGRWKTQPDIAALEEVWRDRKPEPREPVRAIEGPAISEDERRQCLSILDGLAKKLRWNKERTA